VEVYVVPNTYIEFETSDSKVGQAAWPPYKNLKQCYKAIEKKPNAPDEWELWPGRLLAASCESFQLLIFLSWMKRGSMYIILM
jgi:hypothetical protein